MLKELAVIGCLTTSLVGYTGPVNKTSSDKTMTCTAFNNSDEASIDLKMKFTYTGDTAKTQYQKSIVKAKDEDTYEELVETFEEGDFENKLADMDGVKYSLKMNDEKMEIKEVLKVDFTKITGDDYDIITNGQSNTTNISIKKTKEGLEEQGLTCS